MKKGLKMTNDDILLIKNILMTASQKILLNHDIDLNTSTKGHQDLVTAKDYLMEEYLISRLKKQYPQDSFIAEENHHHELTDENTWIIDPIDGTVNFSYGSPLFGIQIARLKNKKPVFSAMYFPKFDEFHYAIKNHGYFINGKTYRTNENVELSKSLISFGDFSNSNPKSRHHQLKFIDVLNDRCLKTRIHGASSIDFSFVSSGKTQGHILFSRNPWELLPGILFVEEAGGCVFYYDGDAYGFPGQGIILSSNSKIEASLKKTLKLL